MGRGWAGMEARAGEWARRGHWWVAPSRGWLTDTNVNRPAGHEEGGGGGGERFPRTAAQG